jgi:hypothetical protein
MRRITQFVALMVALLFAGQSALSEMPCSHRLHSGKDRAPGCCSIAAGAAGHQLTSDCHGSRLSEPGASECNQSGCSMTTVQMAAQAITPPKFRVDSATSLLAISPLATFLILAQPPRPFEGRSAHGPAKYLLFQVFRI